MGPDGWLPGIAGDGAIAADKVKLVLNQDGDKVLVLTVVGAPAEAKWVTAKGRAYLRVPAGKADFTVTAWLLPKDDAGLIKALK